MKISTFLMSVIALMCLMLSTWVLEGCERAREHPRNALPGVVAGGGGDPYRTEISEVDRALGELLAALEERGRLADTLIVVVADHGESLGEHGEQTHGIFLYQATLHVPLIVAGPGVVAGQRVDPPVGLVDVLPTLVDALALEPVGDLDGRSLCPVLGGAAADADRALYSKSFLPSRDHGWSPLRALRRGSDKYIAAPRPELYSLDVDPREIDDRSNADPERTAELASELAARVAARGHALIGQAHFEAGRFAEAAAEYELSLVVPQPPELYEVLGAIYIELSRPDNARRLLREVVARGDASDRALQMLDALRAGQAPHVTTGHDRRQSPSIVDRTVG
jgi:tetratricopeptide (TPR) repeat protein